MAKFASEWYVERYKAGTLHALQSKGYRLSMAITPPDRVEGKKLHFPIAGVGEASKMKVGDDGKLMNAGRTTEILEVEGYQAMEMIYGLDLDRMTVREMATAQETAGKALGRKHDQVIMDEIHSGSGGYAGVVGAFADPWDLELAITACDTLQDQDVEWDGQVFCPLPSRGWNQMMSFKEFSAADYNGPALPFLKGTTSRSWNGVNWFMVPNKLLPLDGTNRTFYMWHISALGAGNNGALNTVIDWQNKQTGWLANNWMDMGAKVLLPKGIVECRMKSDSPITIG